MDLRVSPGFWTLNEQRMSIMFHLWSADGWVTNPHVAPHVAPCCPVCLCAMWKCRANFKHDWVQLDPQGQFDASTFIRIKLRYISIHVIVKWLVHLSISISCWWSDLQHSPKKLHLPSSSPAAAYRFGCALLLKRIAGLAACRKWPSWRINYPPGKHPVEHL